MNKEEVDKFCKEYYGFTLEDADGSIGYWMGKYQELQQENKELHNKIDKTYEIVKQVSYELNINFDDVLEILKDSDVDGKEN